MTRFENDRNVKRRTNIDTKSATLLLEKAACVSAAELGGGMPARQSRESHRVAAMGCFDAESKGSCGLEEEVTTTVATYYSCCYCHLQVPMRP